MRWAKVQGRIICDFAKVGVKLESRVSRADENIFEVSRDAPLRDDLNGTTHVLVGLLCGRPGRDK